MKLVFGFARFCMICGARSYSTYSLINVYFVSSFLSKYSEKEIFWKYSSQRLITADLV